MADGPDLYKVGRLAQVDVHVQTLAARARQKGLYISVIAALANIEEKPRTAPADWGDPLFNTKLPGGVVCHGMKSPLNVHFFLHQGDRTVVILEIRALAGSPLAED